jgi:hypothetical protein
VNDDTPSALPQAYSIKGLCRAYAVGRTTAYEQIKLGRLRARKLGRSTIILRADAEEWADGLEPIETQKKGPALLAERSDPTNPSHGK